MGSCWIITGSGVGGGGGAGGAGAGRTATCWNAARKKSERRGKRGLGARPPIESILCPTVITRCNGVRTRAEERITRAQPREKLERWMNYSKIGVLKSDVNESKRGEKIFSPRVESEIVFHVFAVNSRGWPRAPPHQSDVARVFFESFTC